MALGPRTTPPLRSLPSDDFAIVGAMRSLLLVCVLCGVAVADSRSDIAALVDKHLHAYTDELGLMVEDNRAALDETLDPKDAMTPGFQPMEPPGYRIWGDAPLGEHPRMVALTHSVKAMRIVVDSVNRTAYFTGDIEASWTTPAPESKGQLTAVRAIGIAVRRGKLWKLVAVDYGRTLPDKDLFKLADPKLVRADPKEREPVRALVAAWFDAKVPVPIERDRAPLATALARGTSAAESASGAAADKLVKQWDAIKMFRRGPVNGAQWADTYYATCGVAIPTKAGAVPMVMRAIFVKDKDGNWKWVSLDFAAPEPK